MDQDDDGLAAETAPGPRPGEVDLIGCPVARATSEAKASEQIAGRERGGNGDDDAHHDHRIPTWDSCSIRSGDNVAALLR